jgi:hypothetical protein
MPEMKSLYKSKTPRLFQLKHALMCNPAVGPSLVQHWAKQGYLLHGTERHGSVERLTFSFSELVYLSILARLSWFGALTKETLAFYSSSADTDENETGRFENKSLMAARWRVFHALERSSWNMLLTIRPIQVKLTAPSSRSKQIEIQYDVHLHDAEPHADINVKRGVTFTDAVVIIDARQIHDQVKAALGIT